MSKCSNQSLDIEKFNNPPSEFRTVLFWSWNETMEPEELNRQAELMKQAGCGGGFIHSRVGLLTEYLSEDWFKAIDAAIESSKKQGFKVFLYDEDKWPSGFAGGKVPMADKSFRLKSLVARPAGSRYPENCEKLAEFRQGLQVYKWTAPLGHDWFNGTCYADLMDKDAMAHFVKQSYQVYYDRYSKDYGDTIVCEFTDEPCTIFRGRIPEGAVPYTDALPETFKELQGYDPTEHYYKLFTDCEGAEKFRIHYFRTINYLFEHNFTKQLSDWCGNHNIAMTGHYMLETEMYGQQTWGTKVMANYRHLQWPGIDHLGKSIDETITGKQCQSVVNQFGKERMLSEMFGACGQDMSFADRLWIASQQIQLGVNLISPHLSLYTMVGCRKRDFPPNLFYQQPWWPVNDQLDVPLGRLCYAMSKGKYNADILMIHPQESTFALWQTRCDNCRNTLEGENLEWDVNSTIPSAKEKIDQLDASVKDFILKLLNHQCHFDFGDETIISDNANIVVKENKPFIKIGQMKYSKVILPDMYTIARTTVDILENFISLGGKVYSTKKRPPFIDGEICSKLEKLFEKIEILDKQQIVKELSREQGVKLTSVEEVPGHIWTHIRDLPNDSKTVLISNLNRDETFKGNIVINGNYDTVQLFDHWDGGIKKVNFNQLNDAIEIPLALEPVQSRLIMLNSDQQITAEINLKKPELSDNIELSFKDFDVKRLDKNALLLDSAFWKEGDGEFSNKALPLTAIQEKLNKFEFDGKLELNYKFNVKQVPEGKVDLIIEHPEYYSIFINGNKIGNSSDQYWLDIRFTKLDIIGLLKEGENSVHLICNDFRYGDQRKYDDIFARYGTEIEAVYILGDFDIQAKTIDKKFNKSCWQQLNIEPDLRFIDAQSIAIAKPEKLNINDVTSQALPFYAGRVEYSTILPEVEFSGELQLNFEKLIASCSQIYIDDELVGSVFTKPYSIDISKYYKPGSKLRIILYSSLRNLLGPHHHTNGEIFLVSPQSFLPHFDNQEDYGQNVLSWDRCYIEPNDWKAQYCLVNYGNIGNIVLKGKADSTHKCN